MIYKSDDTATAFLPHKKSGILRLSGRAFREIFSRSWIEFVPEGGGGCVGVGHGEGGRGVRVLEELSNERSPLTLSLAPLEEKTTLSKLQTSPSGRAGRGTLTKSESSRLRNSPQRLKLEDQQFLLEFIICRIRCGRFLSKLQRAARLVHQSLIQS